MADRGLYARWFYRRIACLGWHPFLRINQGAKFRPAGQTRWYWLRELVNTEDGMWRGQGTAFSTRKCQLQCTLVAWWGAGHEEPWFVLTDLSPNGCDATWYGLRTWCEQGFKCNKRGGWQWQQTRMTDPERAARLWLALSVASLWMVTLGSQLETRADGRKSRSSRSACACFWPRPCNVVSDAGHGFFDWADCGCWCRWSPLSHFRCPGSWSRSLGPRCLKSGTLFFIISSPYPMPLLKNLPTKGSPSPTCIRSTGSPFPAS